MPNRDMLEKSFLCGNQQPSPDEGKVQRLSCSGSRGQASPKCAETVKCKTCGETKPISDFYIHKSTGNPRAHCKKCLYANQRAYAKSNPDIVKKSIMAANERYRHSDHGKTKRNEYTAEYHKKHAERINASMVQWRADNKGAVNHYKAKRRALHKKATPAWADINSIKTIYTEARSLGMVVDHIIPLRGANVSGLHVENNLRIISRSENARKYNKFTA